MPGINGKMHYLTEYTLCFFSYIIIIVKPIFAYIIIIFIVTNTSSRAKINNIYLSIYSMHVIIVKIVDTHEEGRLVVQNISQILTEWER